jgi:hypothetical protein
MDNSKEKVNKEEETPSSDGIKKKRKKYDIFQKISRFYIFYFYIFLFYYSSTAK